MVHKGVLRSCAKRCVLQQRGRLCAVTQPELGRMGELSGGKKSSVQTGTASCHYRLAVPSCQHLGQLQLKGLLFCSGGSSVPARSLLWHGCLWKLRSVAAGLAVWGTTARPFGRAWSLGAGGCTCHDPEVLGVTANSESCKATQRGASSSGNKGDGNKGDSNKNTKPFGFV